MTVQWLCEIDAYNMDSASVETLYFSTHPLNTKGGDTPADTPYQPRMGGSVFSITRSIINGDRLGGSRAPASGFIELLNNDGGLDYLRNYSFDTRQVRLYRGVFGQARGDFDLQWQGVGEQMEYDDNTIRLRVKDRLYIFDKPIQTNLYASSAANALEGQPKPILIGINALCEPPLIDSTNRVYQLHDGAMESSPLNIYDRLVQLTITTDYTVNAAAGTFTLNASPAGIVAADAAKYTTSGFMMIKDILEHVVTNYAGLVSGDLDASFSSVSSPLPLAMYIRESENIASVLDKFINSVGGFYYFTRLDKFTAKILTEAQSPADISLSDRDIVSYQREQTAMPVYSVRIGYNRNNRPHTKAEAATSVALLTAARASQEWQYKSAVDNAVKTAYPNAREIELLCYSDNTTPSSVQDEADRILALYKTQRDVIAATVNKNAFSFELGQTVYVEFERYGFEAGAFFKVISTTDYGDRDVVDVTLWGSMDNAFILAEDETRILLEDGSGFILQE